MYSSNKNDNQTRLIKKVSSPISADLPANNVFSEKSLVELNEFYKFLDEKTIKHIKNTNAESINRITHDMEQTDYETNGAISILEALK